MNVREALDFQVCFTCLMENWKGDEDLSHFPNATKRAGCRTCVLTKNPSGDFSRNTWPGKEDVAHNVRVVFFFSVFERCESAKGPGCGLWDPCPPQSDAPETPKGCFQSLGGVARQNASTLNFTTYCICKNLSASEGSPAWNPAERDEAPWGLWKLQCHSDTQQFLEEILQPKPVATQCCFLNGSPLP